ncbi:MAG: DUF4153 domain-containing protein [Bacteroidota bacterium]
MQSQIRNNAFVLIGVLLYNFLFWQEKLGLNGLLFSLFIMGSLLYLHPDRRTSKEVILTGLGTLTTAFFIVIINSDFVKVIHILSLLTFTGFVQQRELRFIFYAFLLIVGNVCKSPIRLIQQLHPKHRWWPKGRWKYHLNVFVIPVLILGLFYLIYYGANPQFAELSNHFWNHLFGFFQWDISWARVCFVGTGLCLVGGLLWENRNGYFAKREANKTYTLKRNRQAKDKFHIGQSIIGLKNEYRSGLVLLIALNSLLLIVNATDIINVWLNPAPEGAKALMQYVHEGTYLLILAILLAMLIILVLFRKNLNFYPLNQQLKRLAYFWLFQNAVLAFSVGIRNFKYIEYCGLAYKRIGIVLFLLLTLYGLFSLYQKIREQRSLHFVLHCNAWALYALLIASSLVNWDVAITRFNITAQTPKGIDALFLLEDVSDKNLFLLHQYSDLLKDEGNVANFAHHLRQKTRRFKREQQQYSWLSWNWIDHKNKKQLEKAKF